MTSRPTIMQLYDIKDLVDEAINALPQEDLVALYEQLYKVQAINVDDINYEIYE